MIFTVTILCALCLAIGVFAGRYSMTWQWRRKFTTAMKNTGRVRILSDEDFTRVDPRGWGRGAEGWGSVGGTVSCYTPNDDSVPVFISPGGKLAYPYGDHSGPRPVDDEDNHGGRPDLPPD